MSAARIAAQVASAQEKVRVAASARAPAHIELQQALRALTDAKARKKKVKHEIKAWLSEFEQKNFRPANKHDKEEIRPKYVELQASELALEEEKLRCETASATLEQAQDRVRTAERQLQWAENARDEAKLCSATAAAAAYHAARAAEAAIALAGRLPDAFVVAEGREFEPPPPPCPCGFGRGGGISLGTLFANASEDARSEREVTRWRASARSAAADASLNNRLSASSSSAGGCGATQRTCLNARRTEPSQLGGSSYGSCGF